MKGDHIMKFKIFVSTLLLVVLSVGAFAVNAQSENPVPPERQGQDAGAGPRRVTGNIIAILIGVVTDQTGLTTQEIRMQAQEGATLAEIIQSNGGNVDSVVQATMAEVNERVMNAVQDGIITPQQGERILSNVPEVIERVLSSELPTRPGGDQAPFARALVQRVAEATGLEPGQVVEQLNNGASLADVLAANGVDVNAFIDGLIAEQTANLRQRLEEALNHTRDNATAEG